MNFHQAYTKTLKEHWSDQRFYRSGYLQKVKLLYKNDIKKSFSKKDIKDITPRKLKKWYANKVKSKSPCTANKCIRLMSKVFQHLIEEGHEIVNPCKAIKKAPEASRSNYADSDTLKKIEALAFEAMQTEPDKGLFILLLIYTGARPSSIARAKMKDLRTVESSNGTYGVLEVTGKTYQSTMEKDKIIIPGKVFKLIDKSKRPWQPVACKSIPHKLWYEIREKINKPNLWLRDLRRSFASSALSNGVPIDVVAELLNHKSVQTTKIYAKLDESKKIDAVNKVASFF